MSRPAGFALPTNSRERLKNESKQAGLLREMYPQLAELRVEFDFDDGTTRPPSVQSYFHFPPARGFFRYPCPCHSCSGEFDLSGYVAELAGSAERARLVRRITVPCPGLRPHERQERIACPIRASIRISARMGASKET